VPLGDTEALEAAWTASDEYTARNKAGKERLSKPIRTRRPKIRKPASHHKSCIGAQHGGDV
jgi:hypothetical protein